LLPKRNMSNSLASKFLVFSYSDTLLFLRINVGAGSG
jgi:hypothetical protein